MTPILDASEIFGATPASPPSPSSDNRWPAPLAAVAYHGLIGEIVQTIAPQTEADPAALVVQMLAMLGSIVGRTAHFRVGADTHYLNLFVAVVGDSAKARKGVSRQHVQRMFEPLDAPWATNSITSGLSSGEGLIHAVRDAIEKQQPIKQKGRIVGYETVTEDVGVDDKRLLVVEPELASTLKVMAREGSTLSPVIRQAWDGHDLRTLTKTSNTRATKPHISIIGHITAEELRRSLDATETANGFANRFLWAVARRSRLLPDGGQPVAFERFGDELRAVLDHARRNIEYGRDPGAKALWYSVYERLSAAQPGMFGAVTARAEAQTMRLACLYAVADRTYAIGESHLRAALEVWRYCRDSVAYLFGDRTGDPTVDAIVDALRRAWPDCLTRTEISGLFGRNKPAEQISRALTRAAELQLAKCDGDRKENGRPVEYWFSTREATK